LQRTVNRCSSHTAGLQSFPRVWCYDLKAATFPAISSSFPRARPRVCEVVVRSFLSTFFPSLRPPQLLTVALLPFRLARLPLLLPSFFVQYFEILPLHQVSIVRLLQPHSSFTWPFIARLISFPLASGPFSPLRTPPKNFD